MVLLDAPKIKLGIRQIQKSKSGNLKTSELAKTRAGKSSRLVWLKSSKLPWRASWWKIGCQILVLKAHNLSTHDASWVRMMHHEYSWCIMSTHDAARVLMMHLFWEEPTTTKDQFWRQQWLPSTILEVFYLQVTFQEIPKSWTNNCECAPVTVFDETLWNRCGIAAQSLSNHRFY